MSLYPNHFPSKILNNFRPLYAGNCIPNLYPISCNSPGFPRIRENFLTRRDVAEGEVSTRRGIIIYPRVGIWQMGIPFEWVPLEDSSVPDGILPMIPSVPQEHVPNIWKLSWDHRISVHRQNKSPDMRCRRASHRGFGYLKCVPLV